jgi:hypothetical protein
VPFPNRFFYQKSSTTTIATTSREEKVEHTSRPIDTRKKLL